MTAKERREAHKQELRDRLDTIGDLYSEAVGKHPAGWLARLYAREFHRTRKQLRRLEESS